MNETERAESHVFTLQQRVFLPSQIQISVGLINSCLRQQQDSDRPKIPLRCWAACCYIQTNSHNKNPLLLLIMCDFSQQLLGFSQEQRQL